MKDSERREWVFCLSALRQLLSILPTRLWAARGRRKEKGRRRSKLSTTTVLVKNRIPAGLRS